MIEKISKHSLIVIAVAVFFYFAVPAPQAYADSINAISCSQTDIQNAVNQAQNGDTIQVPAGTCTWNSTLSISKAITLQGAGVGNTIIRDGMQNGTLMVITLVSGSVTRVSGFEFRDGGRADQFTGATIAVSGSASDNGRVRIDHNKFDHLISYPNIDAFKVYGVIDHNEFLYVPTKRAINVHHGHANDVKSADDIWAAPANLGTDQFLFIEDNSFAYDPGLFYAHIDCFDGGRFVFRYNSVTRGWIECHGTDSTGRTRGGRAVEVYNNTFNSTPGLASTVTNARSATWVVHDNTILGYTYGTGPGAVGPGLQLNAYRNVQGQSPFGGADGMNPWDKNVPGGPFLTGTADNGGSWEVTVSGAGWTPNQWAGYSIRKTSDAISCSSAVREDSIWPMVTVVCNGHGLGVGDWFTMRGADQLQYNLENAVAEVVDANTFKFRLFWGATPATPATGNIVIRKGNDFSYIIRNTADTISFTPGTLGPVYDLTFSPGDNFELWLTDESMDQPCSGRGTNLGGGFDPALPAGWNNQVVEGCYEWNNTKESGADVDFGSSYFLQVVEGEHYFNDTTAPGYTSYTYPHPLVSESPVYPTPDTYQTPSVYPTPVIYLTPTTNTTNANTSNTSNNTTTSGTNSTPSAPTLTFKAEPQTIAPGQSSTLSWNSTNTSYCSASGIWSGVKLTSDSEKVSPSTSSYYSITCVGGGGSVTKSLALNVSESGIDSSPAYTSTGSSATESSSQPLSVSNDFQVGDKIVTTSNLNVRDLHSTATGKIQGIQTIGSFGTVAEGPFSAQGYKWWRINWDKNPRIGWSVENYLSKINTSTRSPASGGQLSDAEAIASLQAQIKVLLEIVVKLQNMIKERADL